MPISTEFVHPRESGKFIADHAKLVKIKNQGILKLSSEILSNLKTGKISITAYGDDSLHPNVSDKSVLDWLFVLDTLNFCFWTPGDATKWKVNGQTGYFALAASIRRAVEDGIDIINPKFYSKVTEKELSNIFRSDDGVVPIPLLSTRVQCLHEVGQVLLNKYDGTFENCIKEANKSAVKLLQLVVDNFPCFRDESMFDGRKVTFYKRAQILVADVWSRFYGEGLGEFPDIAEMTMFADYRVPQVLVHFGVMEYAPELMDLLKQDKIFDSGSREEIEIRGCSIYAVDLLDQEVKKSIKSNSGSDDDCAAINSILIDYFLWLYRRQHAAELEYIPFHKVLGKYY